MVARLNYINIGIMLISAVLAVFLPFELLLFSYVFLGPLHYLTEISWLHKRNYFSPGKYDLAILSVLCFAILFPTLLRLSYTLWGTKDDLGHLIYTPWFRVLLARTTALAKATVFITFVVAALLVLAKSVKARIIGAVVAIALAALFRTGYFVDVIVAMFVPTLIHVYVFTGAFILVGALKSRSFSGALSLVVFTGCAIALFFLFPGYQNKPPVLLVNAYNSAFLPLTREIGRAIYHEPISAATLLQSRAAMLITRFFAYAYTYHYLNWFSKTQVIKWHQIPLRQYVVIFALWGATIALYFINYKMGIAASYFLSMMHVVLEFPLNFQSFRDIGREFRKVVTAH